VEPIDITDRLHAGSNLIAIKVLENTGTAFFDCIVMEEDLTTALVGACCLPSGCTAIHDSYTKAACEADGGTPRIGGQYTCGYVSPCEKPEAGGDDDPLQYFSTELPLPSLPASITFTLIDTLPATMWYALPSALGGDTIYVTGATGDFTVEALPTANPDSAELFVTSMDFSAPSVTINGLESGENSVALDSVANVGLRGSYCYSTGVVDIVVPALITNNLYTIADPVKSLSHIRGHLDENTGVAALLGQGYNVVPLCCVGTRGNIRLEGSCDTDDPVVDVADLTDLISHLFIDFEPLCCTYEADISPLMGGGAPDGYADVADLTAMIDHLFISFPVLPECP